MPEPTVWKVLVVEDRAGISASLLRSRADFEVAAAHRLAAVERLFREAPGAPFQAVLLDLSLADIADPQGLDAYRRVRAMAPGLPIVVIAASGADEAAQALAAEGAAACLPRASTTADVLAWTLRQAVLRARQEARRYRDLFDSVPIGILLAAGRRVVMANPAARASLGYAEEELARASVLDLFPPSMHGALGSALDASLAGEPVEAAFPVALRRKDGTPAPARALLKGALVNDAPALALYLAFVDAPIAREASAAPAAAAPAPRVAEEAPAYAPPAAPAAPAGPARPSAETELRMESLGRLAAGIAHDFNNLFTAINGYSDHLLSLPGAAGPMARGLQAIRKAGEAAAAMTRSLMAFSHPGSGEPRAVPVDASVDDLAPMLASLLGGSVQLRIRPGAAGAAALLEGGQLEEILLALCANAKEAMPRGGALFLESAAVASTEGATFTHLAPASPGPFVVLSVRDTGEGMSPGVLARLFEPYFSTREARAGAGHGLASVYGMVRQAGGGIAAESRPGQGSHFRIWLPRAQAVPAASAPAPDSASGPAAESEEEAAARRVLVVEDDPGLREMLRAVLERYGYRVEEAEGGGDAEEAVAAAAEAPRLVITDVLLRDGLGPDLAARLRAARPTLRVLFISGHSLETLADQGIRLSPDEFLEKPFTPARLAEKVKALLAAPARPAR